METVIIDKHALCIIIDTDINKPLGTGFSFLKENWVITAKHVVIDQGIPRKIRISFLDAGSVEAKVIAIHPELDIALLNYDGESKCKKPLMPGYHEFASSKRLIMSGYSPSSSEGTDLTVRLESIENYVEEIRERSDTEITIHFKAEHSEGGNSGGAIIAEGGNVVAVAIETYYKDNEKYCMATSIRSIMKNLTFGEGWENFK